MIKFKDILIFGFFVIAAFVAVSGLVFVSCLKKNVPNQFVEKSFTLEVNGFEGDVDTTYGLFFYSLGKQIYSIEPALDSGQTRLIALREVDYNAILSREILRVVYDNASESNKLVTINRFISNFKPAFFISKVGEEIFLIKWTGVTVNSTTNVGTATFTIKK